MGRGEGESEIGQGGRDGQREGWKEGAINGWMGRIRGAEGGREEERAGRDARLSS